MLCCDPDISNLLNVMDRKFGNLFTNISNIQNNLTN